MSQNDWTLKLYDESGKELRVYRFDPVRVILSDVEMDRLLDSVRTEIREDHESKESGVEYTGQTIEITPSPLVVELIKHAMEAPGEVE